MRTTPVFWSLVRHEMALKGNRRKNNSAFTRKWCLIYMAIVLVGGGGTALYFALHNQLKLPYLWFATLGLPYMMLMFGVNSLKREWDNETQGWWLTLPYPRSRLVAAKWLASLILVLAALIAILIAGTAMAMAIGLGVSGYTLADVGNFVVIGVNWLLPLACFSPLLLASGMLIAASQYTRLRPVSPLFWFVFMASCSLFYQSFKGFGVQSMVDQVSEGVTVWQPFPWELAAVVAAGWLLAGGMIALISYVLDKKLSL